MKPEEQIDPDEDFDPAFSLSLQIAQARKGMGEKRWRQVEAEWAATTCDFPRTIKDHIREAKAMARDLEGATDD